MRLRVVMAYLALLLLAGFSGYLQRELYALQHWGDAQWVKALSYLVVIPFTKVVIFAPGIAIGFFLRSTRYLALFAVGSLAYLPYQYMAGSGLATDHVTLLAHAMAYGVAVVVAFLAGSRL